MNLKRWLRDPLLAFLALGTAIFAGSSLLGRPSDEQTIRVDQAEINRLQEQWRAQMGRAPSEEELSGLVEQFIREEIYYREALRLSLDQGDVIVRRRLVQKLTFLTEDIATSQPPSEAEQRAFYAANPERYRLPARYSFRHRYFSSDRRADAEADALAAQADPSLPADPFMLQKAYAERSQREIGDLFGREFAAALATLQPGSNWQGPLRSAYGWHLVQVDKALPEALPPLAQVAARVANDLDVQRRQDANTAYYEELRSRYLVISLEAGPA